MTGIDPKNGLLIALGLFTVFYLVIVIARVQKAVNDGEKLSLLLGGPKSVGYYTVGFVTNFFDTLGIGSYAPTTAIFRRFKIVNDEHIPGTMNIGHTLPTVVQAIIFTKLVPVDPTTLALMIAAAALGSYIGSGIVAGLPRRSVQWGMGIAMVAAATLMILSIGGWMPGGGDLLKLEGTKLGLALLGNFILGSLMTIGIGLYAPCMVLIYLLGMTPTAAFPIMMGSCAFLMPVASYRFIKKDSFNIKAMLGLMIGGLPAVLIAALVVKSLPLTYVKGLVVLVVLYTAYGMLRAARENRGVQSKVISGGPLSVAE